jgi:hypothetical protein
VVRDGGIFHLWGHSWELQETAQWQRLEELFSIMSEYRSELPCLTNSQLCQLDLPMQTGPLRRRSVA